MSENYKHRQIVTVHNTKLGVLLYDDVIPLRLLSETLETDTSLDVDKVVSIIDQIVPEKLKHLNKIGLLRSVNVFLFTRIYHAMANSDAVSKLAPHDENAAKFKEISAELDQMGYFSPKLSDLWKSNLKVLFSEHSELMELPVLAPQSAKNKVVQDKSPLLTLTNIPIIDTSSASWEKILEFKKDKESASQLRRFRLFLADNYEGKSKAFVEDDLSERLEAYENIIKQWRFDTYTAPLTPYSRQNY